MRAQVIRGEGLIYMVLEYGDIDLARLLARHEAARAERGAGGPDENFIRLYWQQMLQARRRWGAQMPVLMMGSICRRRAAGRCSDAHP
jgi:hypothetical protein